MNGRRKADNFKEDARLRTIIERIGDEAAKVYEAVASALVKALKVHHPAGVSGNETLFSAAGSLGLPDEKSLDGSLARITLTMPFSV